MRCELIEALVNRCFPAGAEGQATMCVRDWLAARGVAGEVDAAGNLVCRRAGEGKKWLVAAELAAPGLYAVGADEKGNLRCELTDGLNRGAAFNRRALFESGREGVLRPVNDGEKPASDKKELTGADFYVDLGGPEEASGVRPGEAALLTGSVREGLPGALIGSRLSVTAPIAAAAGLLLRAERPACDLTVAFCVAGGLNYALRALRPDVVVALAAVAASDGPDGAPHGQRVPLGQGPCLMLRCGAHAAPAWLEKAVFAAGAACGAGVQTGFDPDGGAMSAAVTAGCAGVSLRLPVRHLGTGGEIALGADVDAMTALLAALTGRG